MAATRTGTASQVNASAADSGSTSVTVPADATAVIATYEYWDSNSNAVAPSFTLGGNSFTSQAHFPDVDDKTGVGVQTLTNIPGSGTQTFAWDWGGASGARTEGGLIVLTYVKGVNTADLVRDADATASITSNNVSLTLTTESTDLVIAHAQRFDATDNNGPTFTLDGTVYVSLVVVNQHVNSVSEVTAGASTTTINMTNETYSGMTAIALKEDTTGGGSTPGMKLIWRR